MHEPMPTAEPTPEPPKLLPVPPVPARLAIQRRVAGPVADPDPDDEFADTSIEHWYFCGAGSVMRSR